LYNGVITGASGLTVTGLGGVQFSTSGESILDLGASATYQGNTTISNAVIQPNSGASQIATVLVNMLPTTTVLNLVNNGVLNMDNHSSNQQVAGLTGDATGVVGTTDATSAVVFTIGGSGVYAFPGVIGAVTLQGKAGSNAQLSLDMAGAGRQILSGSNTYTGATSINSGTLQLGNGGATGSLAPASVITDNGALAFDRNNVVTQGTDFSSAAITGSGSLIQLGSGTLVLSASNTYAGGTIVNAGELLVTNNEAIADGTNLAVGDASALSLLPAAIVPSPPAAAPAVTPVPEPGTLLLLAAGGALLAIGRRRRRR
jgi:autotransporter family porin